jgi:WD40 repeat protein
LVWSVAFASDGRRVLSGSWDKTARIWDAQTGQVLHTHRQSHLSESTTTGVPFAFFADGGQVLSAGFDTLALWESTSGRVIHGFEGHASSMLAIDASPSGAHVLAGGRHGALKLWNVEAAAQFARSGAYGKGAVGRAVA